MKPVIKALLIASFCLPFVSCKDEKSIQQEIHENQEALRQENHEKLKKMVGALEEQEKEKKAAAEEADGKDQE